MKSITYSYGLGNTVLTLLQALVARTGSVAQQQQQRVHWAQVSACETLIKKRSYPWLLNV